MSADPHTSREGGGAAGMLAGLLIISMALLALEILQVKIFAYSLDALRIFTAVGLCLLGLGASATILAMLPPLDHERGRRLAALCAAGAALTTPLAHAAFAILADDRDSILAAFGWQIALATPYFLIGMTSAVVMMLRSARIGQAYAVNLAGSALGCVLVFPLLDAFGAELGTVVLGAMMLAAGLLIAAPATALSRTVFAAAAVVLLLCGAGAESIMKFPPEHFGQLSVTLRAAEKLREKHDDDSIRVEYLLRRWDRTARVEVVRIRGSTERFQSRIGNTMDILFMLQDSSAGSLLFDVSEDLGAAKQFYERTVYGAGYEATEPKSVLVIGLGGGPDVLTALYHGAERIVGVDINGTIIDLVDVEFAEHAGSAYARPEVTIKQLDGRTYLRSTDEQFDLIQLSGVDTKSLLAAGSLSVNENYLYTREAMVEMLDRLAPDGILSIVRFQDFDMHRLTSIAVAGLRDIGVSDPELNILTVGQGSFRAVMIKRTPFSAAEIDRVHEWVEREGSTAPDIVIPYYDWVGVSFKKPMEIYYSPAPRPTAATDYYEALAAGRHDEYLDSAKVDLSSPDDDRPYFFMAGRPGEALTNPPWYLAALYKGVGQLAAVAALFILAPLLLWRRRGLGGFGAGGAIVHFVSLGCAFMFVEIGLIQRFVVLLGHQSYAVTVVMLGLLLGASAGSIVSARFALPARRPLTLALVGLALGVVVCAFGLAPLFRAASGLDFGGRLVLALVVLFALGFPMGMPFPLALRSLSHTDDTLVPWGIGVNGFASVIASTGAVAIALVVGLRALVLIGAALYLLALATSPALRPRDAA